MNSLKQKSLLLLLCLLALARAHAQMGWARSYNISTAIPGANWNDVCKVLKVDQNRHIIAGTLTNGSAVVARFSQDGIAGWVSELKGTPGSAIILKDIVEYADPVNPGYVICGIYNSGGTDYNYLARIDALGNVIWDHYWHANARLVALLLTANNIIATGSARTGSVTTTTAYRFDMAGTALNAKIISTDPDIIPVDILEDPLYNGSGGFVVLTNFKNVGTTNIQPYCVFIDYNLSFLQAYVLPFSPPPPQPFLYTNAEAVCFEQDQSTRNFIILANVNGAARDYRPSVIQFNPATPGTTSSVVLEAPGFSNTEPLQGSALNLINGTITDGIMVVAVRNPISNARSYTWRMNSALKTTDFFEQWLAIPNVSNRSLCLAKDNQHYVLAGHDAGGYLTLNVVNLNGDKIDNAGSSKCINSESWIDEHPPVKPNTYSYSSNNLTVSPTSVTTNDPRSWWHEGACWCAEVPVETYYRYSYPQIPYDNWELNINRATHNSSTGNVYIANTLTVTSPERAYMIELNAAGQNTNTWGTASGFEKEGRQMLQSRHNGDLIFVSRTANTGGLPGTSVGRTVPGGSPSIWGVWFQNSRTPGRMYLAEALNSTDILVVADLDGLDETSNTHDLMIARLTSGGSTIYYQEIPITYNGAPRDNFRVHALEPTRDGGFAICGSSGYQNSDFIAGFVMKFDASGNLLWQYDFRRQTPNNCYNLNGPNDCRSASVFYDLRHSPANGYYIAGYTSDHDENGQSSSFWNGLVVHLNNLGVELAVQEYNDVDGRLTSFKGITVAGNDIGIVGDLADPGMAGRTDLFVRLDRTTLGFVTAQTYGHGDNSTLHDIFQTSAGAAAGGAVYVMVGSTTDWNNQLTPQAISTDANGSTGCESPVDMGTATPVNDPVSLDLDAPVDQSSNPMVDELVPTCVEAFDICEPVAPAAIRQPTGLNDFGTWGNKTKETSGISAYPNPASTMLNLEVPEFVKVRDIIIIDINGRVVYHSTQAMGSRAEINISELPKGMYAVKMETSTGKRFTRFVKQ